MTNAAALLPHEKICPDCCGDRKVMEVRPCISPTATEPFMQTGLEIDCPVCDGTGVVVRERRDRFTRAGGEIAAEFTELRNALAIEHAICVEQTETIRRLIDENRIQRERILGMAPKTMDERGW